MLARKTLIIFALCTAFLTAPMSANSLRKAGTITFFGGVGLTLGAFNWSSKCKPGYEVSYLGYDCYADTAKRTHAKLARPALLGVGIAMMVAGPITFAKGKKKPQRRVELRLAPTQAQLQFRFWVRPPPENSVS